MAGTSRAATIMTAHRIVTTTTHRFWRRIGARSRVGGRRAF